MAGTGSSIIPTSLFLLGIWESGNYPRRVTNCDALPDMWPQGSDH